MGRLVVDGVGVLVDRFVNPKFRWSKMTFSRFPLARNGLYGVFVYVLTYTLVYVWYSGNVSQALAQTNLDTETGQMTAVELLGDATVPEWKSVGWFFYGANGVPIQLPDLTRFVTANVLFHDGGLAYVFVLVPIILFTIGGFWTYKQIDSRVGQWKYAGVGMALGYVFPMAVGSLLFTARISGRPAGPDILLSIIYGLVIPTLSGAIGARITA